MIKKRITAHIAKKENKNISISTDYIRLDSALKLADIVQSGGIAKMLILDGEIKVNSEVCLQRGKKLRKGDSFEYQNTVYKVV
jgi:ribosome-associated protein